MKRRKPLSTSPYAAHKNQPQVKPGTALIRLNTGSIRNKALKDYKKAERDLDRSKQQLKRFHEEDIPGFRSWIHQTFGHLLSRQRELIQAIDEKKNTLFDIETLSFRYHLSKAVAYKKLLWRRAHPTEAAEEDRQWEEAMERKREKQKQSHKHDFFADEDEEDDADFLDPEAPFSPDDFSNIPDAAWEDFCDYFEDLTGVRPPARNNPVPKAENKTVKELYRSIVRRLHPDHHGQMSEGGKRLWHEAQAAYRRKDTNTLYNILARCDGEESGLGAHSAVSLIQNLTRQLKQTLRSTKQEIKQVKSNPAWDFKTRAKDPKFSNGIRRELEAEISDGEWNLRSMDELLTQLEREADRPSRQARRGRRYRSVQDDFLF